MIKDGTGIELWMKKNCDGPSEGGANRRSGERWKKEWAVRTSEAACSS